jgi:hypothetical protein
MEIRARVVGRAKIDPEKRVVRLEAFRFDRVQIENASFGAGRGPSQYVECSSSLDSSHSSSYYSHLDFP